MNLVGGTNENGQNPTNKTKIFCRVCPKRNKGEQKLDQQNPITISPDGKEIQFSDNSKSSPP